MRFNFRGVGRSQGRFDGGIGEIGDAASALDWMQAVNPNHGGLWIAGYSFGAFIGMQLLMRRPEISGWVSVAPPANHYDFGFLAPCPCGGLMLHGDADELVPEIAVRKLVDKLNTQKGVSVDYRVFQGADHVFADHAEKVSEAIDDYCGNRSPGGWRWPPTESPQRQDQGGGEVASAPALAAALRPARWSGRRTSAAARPSSRES